jgi:hypothetical protein
MITSDFVGMSRIFRTVRRGKISTEADKILIRRNFGSHQQHGVAVAVEAVAAVDGFAVGAPHRLIRRLETHRRPSRAHHRETSHARSASFLASPIPAQHPSDAQKAATRDSPTP